MRVKYAAPLAVLLLGLCAGQGRADEMVRGTPLYPQPGSSAGSIAVKGSVIPSVGWTVPYMSAKIVAWQDGQEVATKTITLTKVLLTNTYTFDDTIKGLQSGATYNVTVEVIIVSPMNIFETVVTAPGSALAQ